MSEFPSIPTLVKRWEAARTRTFENGAGANAEDYWTELRLGAQIAREAQYGRWVVVAELLRAGSVKSWARVGETLGMTEIEAHDGFTGWISGQVDLHRRTGQLGVTDAEAERLYELAEAVTL